MREKCKWILDKYGQPHNSILEIMYFQEFLVTQSRNGFVNIWEEVNFKYKSISNFNFIIFLLFWGENHVFNYWFSLQNHTHLVLLVFVKLISILMIAYHI